MSLGDGQGGLACCNSWGHKESDTTERLNGTELKSHKSDFPGGTSGKEPTCQSKRHKRHRFYPWVRTIPWRRAWQPTLVFLPGESCGQRNLVGYSPWDCKESDTTSNSVRQHPYKESLFVCLSFSLLKRNSEVGVTLKSTGVYS